MNHNGVVSLPVKDSATINQGDIIQIDSTSKKASSVTGTVAINAMVGVSLADVKQAETGAPVDVHLFSSGGIFEVRASGNVTEGAVVQLAADTNGVADGTTNPIGIALETGVASDLVRILI